MPRLRVICCSNDPEAAAAFRAAFGEPADVTICGGKTMPAALNAAVRSLPDPATDDLLCFAHQDARLDFDADAVVRRYLELLERPGVLGFCGAKRQTSEGHWYTCPPLFGGLCQTDRALLFERPRHGPPGLRFEPVETMDGYCLLMLRSVFDRIGGFDERLDGWHLYDVDVCMRALAAGYANYVLDQPTTHLSWGDSDAEWERLRGVWLATWEDTWFRRPARLSAAVYTVVGDEPGNLELLVASAAGTMGVFALDASGGSTGTALGEAGATVVEHRVDPWRADVAWNAALDLVPGDVDVCIPLAPGEALVGGWTESLAEEWTVRTTRLEHRVLEHRPGADPWLVREARAHARVGYAWVGAAVARLAPLPSTTEHVVRSSTVLIERLVPTERPALALLELAAAERPGDPGPQLDLARALAVAGRWWECAACCRRLLDLPAPCDPMERTTACILLGRCLQQLGEPVQAERWLMQAVSEAPSQREPRVALATLYQAGGDHGGAYWAAKAALGSTEPAEHTLNDPAAWREQAHDLVAVSGYYLGFEQESLAEALAAVEQNPWDRRLIDNHNLVQELTAAPAAEAGPVVDVIVLSNAGSEVEYELTRTTIGSLRRSSPGVRTNVVVVETNASILDEPFAETPLFGPDVEVVIPGGPFGYNTFLRAGYDALAGSAAPSLLMLNNDVVLFGEGFLETLTAALEDVDSVSPLGLRETTWSRVDRNARLVHGYHVGTVLHGWCVLVRRSVVKALGFETLFPPEFTFYAQDIHYGEMLAEHGFTHALVTGAKALHLGASSHHLLPVPPNQTFPPGWTWPAPRDDLS